VGDILVNEDRSNKSLFPQIVDFLLRKLGLLRKEIGAGEDRPRGWNVDELQRDELVTSLSGNR
jgi:hypothetical protein